MFNDDVEWEMHHIYNWITPNTLINLYVQDSAGYKLMGTWFSVLFIKQNENGHF